MAACSNQPGGKYKPGLSPAMDKVLQKLFVEYGIEEGRVGRGGGGRGGTLQN